MPDFDGKTDCRQFMIHRKTNLHGDTWKASYWVLKKLKKKPQDLGKICLNLGQVMQPTTILMIIPTASSVTAAIAPEYSRFLCNYISRYLTGMIFF